MKFVTILGARPQFIKASALSLSIRKHNAKHNQKIEDIIIHTGQHFDKDMSDVFFKELDIPNPKYNLSVANKSHGEMTGIMISKIEEVLRIEKPQFVIVYGDTNSTLAAAIATSKLSIDLVHIESGLRSFNMFMPEEINRILTDRISSILFCPTDAAMQNLKDEGYPYFSLLNRKQRMVQCGDIMLDLVVNNKDHFDNALTLKELGLLNNKFVLCTIHRQENVDDKTNLVEIMKSLNDIAKTMKVVLPIHPRTKQRIEALQETYTFSDDIMIISPQPFLKMHTLIKNSYAVLTDSGGLQKEAYFHQVPCITLRNETEWIETINSNWNTLAGPSHRAILDAFLNLTIPKTYDNLYGFGNAGDIILAEILSY